MNGASTKGTIILLHKVVLRLSGRLKALGSLFAPQQVAQTMVTATGAGSVPAGTKMGSVFNAGATDATWNGGTIPAGVSIPWGPIGFRDTYPEFLYDATGTTLIIEYTI